MPCAAEGDLASRTGRIRTSGRTARRTARRWRRGWRRSAGASGAGSRRSAAAGSSMSVTTRPALLDRRHHLGQRRAIAAGEDVFARSRDWCMPGPSLRPMACSSATPSGFRQRATVSKKVAIVADADMLEHADRDDAVERAGRPRGSPAARTHAVGQAFRRGARARFAQLLLRQRDAGHARAVVARQRQRHAAPAAADVQHRQPRAVQAELGGDVPLLGRSAPPPASRRRAGNRRRNTAGRDRGTGCRAARSGRSGAPRCAARAAPGCTGRCGA